ncbi:MAG: hypothetical protein ACYDAN_02460 [Candidatus Limnocylindrales bacterium]
MDQERSREMARRGRLGALVTLSRNDPVELTRKARVAYRASFADHSACGLCGHPGPIAAGLGPAETARRAEALRRAHYTRMSLRASAKRAGREGGGRS